MRRSILLPLLLLAVLAFVGCAGKNQEDAKPVRSDVVYYCDCGPTCTCHSMATEPGNCTCGKPMKWGHVLKIEGEEALICTCHEGCVCSLDPENPEKCQCGNAVKRLNMAKSGLYFCNCGGACTCNVVSDQPGVCRCGMKLKQVN